jgi:hypothetical protein
MTQTFRRMGILLDDTLPEEQKLGYLVGMVHSAINVPVPELDALFDELDFPKELRPETPRTVFAFQKALRELEQTKTETFVDPSTDISVNFEVEYFIDVLPNDVRQLSRKIQYQSTGLASGDIPDDMKKQLAIYVEKTQKEPEKMALFEFVPAETKKEEDGTETVVSEGRIVRTNLFKENNLSIAEQTQEKYEELERRFGQLTGCYTERYIKHSWYRVLSSVNAIPYMMANGAIYFVPKAGKEILDKFCKIYQEIHKNDGFGVLRILPVIDTQQQREYIKQDVEKRIKEKYEKFLNSAKDQLDNISSEDDIKKVRERWGERKDKFEQELRDTLVKQYSELLKMDIKAKLDTFVPTSDRLQIAKKFLADL